MRVSAYHGKKRALLSMTTAFLGAGDYGCEGARQWQRMRLSMAWPSCLPV